MFFPAKNLTKVKDFSFHQLVALRNVSLIFIHTGQVK